eukprot:956750-Amphidinium_carterae.2
MPLHATTSSNRICVWFSAMRSPIHHTVVADNTPACPVWGRPANIGSATTCKAQRPNLSMLAQM